MNKAKKLFNTYRTLLRDHTTMTVFASIVVVAFLFISSSVALTNLTEQKASARESLEAELVEIEQQTQLEILAERIEEKKQEFFSDVEIGGKAALVYDINTKEVLYERNAREPFPLASIAKVMTVITAQDILPKESAITIDSRALATEGESGLLLDEVWNFKDLADLMLIVSSNDASTAIANAAGERLLERKESASSEKTPYKLFINQMNAKALEIGMEHASFENSSGLDLEYETLPSSVASAYDVTTLLTYALLEYPSILNHSRFGSYSVVSLNGRNFQAENTNQLTDSIPGLLASKTGYTVQAGGNLAVVVDVGLMRPVVIVVLGSTREGRFSDVEKLYDITKQYFRSL
ncbi:MAG: serine hydrolase [Candidatus Paceibacterota bacterium]